MEIWKDVVGYEGLYEVSNEGSVRTKEGKTTFTKRHGVRKWKQRVLKNKTPNGRDCRVSLWKDGKVKDFLVHRLVAIAFLDRIENKNSINHKDGNPRNNVLENLEWCDHKENNNHAFDNGLMPCRKTKLVNIETNEEFIFRSMSKAGIFLGRGEKFISALFIQGKDEVDGYKVTRI